MWLGACLQLVREEGGVAEVSTVLSHHLLLRRFPNPAKERERDSHVTAAPVFTLFLSSLGQA